MNVVIWQDLYCMNLTVSLSCRIKSFLTVVFWYCMWNYLCLHYIPLFYVYTKCECSVNLWFIVWNWLIDWIILAVSEYLVRNKDKPHEEISIFKCCFSYANVKIILSLHFFYYFISEKILVNYSLFSTLCVSIIPNNMEKKVWKVTNMRNKERKILSCNKWWRGFKREHNSGKVFRHFDLTETLVNWQKE